MIEIIPTCNDPMSIYTLIAFSIIVVAGCGISRFAYTELRCIDNRQKQLELNMSSIRTDVAVMKECIENIESAITETKTSLSGINDILLRR